MPFPPHIAAVLQQFGVPAVTKSALYDLYLSIGSRALDGFARLADEYGDPRLITPGDVEGMMRRLAAEYLEASLPQWLEGRPTASFFSPRRSEGRASGMAAPLGVLRDGGEGFVAEVWRVVRSIAGTEQPVPRGILILGRNAHFGGRDDTVSFDVVTEELDDARAVALAEGRQHTIPGSVGETSGTVDVARAIGLVWEVQPNVLKPSSDRNRDIRRVVGRHRNWHLATLAAALLWMEEHGIAAFIIRSEALAAAHEVNPAKPVVPIVEELHDRTVSAVVDGLGASLRAPDEEESKALLTSHVMNAGLRRFVEANGAAAAVWRVE